MNFLIPLLNQSEPLHKPQFGKGHHLQHAFNACALASLGTRAPGGTSGGGEECIHQALSEYNRALRATQTALRDPKQSTEDSVLAAVLLLGMFENITAKQPSGGALGSHIAGAVQIVVARGQKQLKTRTGLQLFIAVRTQLVTLPAFPLSLPVLLLTSRTDNPNSHHLDAPTNGRGLVDLPLSHL